MKTLRLVGLIISLVGASLCLGQTWEDLTANVGANFLGGKDDLVSDGQRLFLIGGEGIGVLMSEDNGQSFRPLNAVNGAGYTLADGWQFDGLFLAHGEVFLSASNWGGVGFQSLHRLPAGAEVWEQAAASGIDTSRGGVVDIVFEPVSGQYFAAALRNGVLASSDARNWSAVIPGPSSFWTPENWLSVATVDGRVFAARGGSSGVVRMTSDGGATWTEVSDFSRSSGSAVGTRLQVVDGTVVAITQGAATTGFEAHLSADAGDTWERIKGLPLGVSDNLSSDGSILYGPTRFAEALNLSFLNYSSDAGRSWQTLPTDGLSSEVINASQNIASEAAIRRQGDFLFLAADVSIDFGARFEGRLYRIPTDGLDLSAPTAILTQPSNLIRFRGQEASFEVEATGDGLTYQWFKDGAAIATGDGPVLTLSSVAEGDVGTYRVVVSGGSGEVTSVDVTLSLRPVEPGRADPTFAPEDSRGRFLFALGDGRLLRVDENWLYLLDAEGQELASRFLGEFVIGLPDPDYGITQAILDAEGRLVTLGYLEQEGTEFTAPYVMARFLADTLEDDPSFTPSPRLNDPTTSLAELPGRGYLATGSFGRVGEVERSNLALFRYDGSFDNTYPAVGGGRIMIGTDGAVYQSGDDGNFPRTDVMRVNADGTRDFTFPVVDLPGSIAFMHPLSRGRFLLVTSEQQIDVYLPEGTRDPSFQTGQLPRPSDGVLRPGSSFLSDQRIVAAAEQTNGRILLVGDFTAYNGLTADAQVRLMPNGSVDPSYFAESGFRPRDAISSPGTITSIALANGFAYFANNTSASTYQDIDARAGLARVLLSDRLPDAGLIAFLGAGSYEGGGDWFYQPSFGWLLWFEGGWAYSHNLGRFVWFNQQGSPLDNPSGFWFLLQKENDLLVWAFTRPDLWVATPGDGRNAYLYLLSGVEGAPGWFFFRGTTQEILRL